MSDIEKMLDGYSLKDQKQILLAQLAAVTLERDGLREALEKIRDSCDHIKRPNFSREGWCRRCGATNDQYGYEKYECDSETALVALAALQSKEGE